MTSNNDLFARVVIANVEQAIGPVADASLPMLHLALADQIVFMLRSGAGEDHVGAILEAVWHQLGEQWAAASDVPMLTHRNDSSYVS